MIQVKSRDIFAVKDILILNRWEKDVVVRSSFLKSLFTTSIIADHTINTIKSIRSSSQGFYNRATVSISNPTGAMVSALKIDLNKFTDGKIEKEDYNLVLPLVSLFADNSVLLQNVVVDTTTPSFDLNSRTLNFSCVSIDDMYLKNVDTQKIGGDGKFSGKTTVGALFQQIATIGDFTLDIPNDFAIKVVEVKIAFTGNETMLDIISKVAKHDKVGAVFSLKELGEGYILAVRDRLNLFASRSTGTSYSYRRRNLFASPVVSNYTEVEFQVPLDNTLTIFDEVELVIEKELYDSSFQAFSGETVKHNDFGDVEVKMKLVLVHVQHYISHNNRYTILAGTNNLVARRIPIRKLLNFKALTQ